MAVCLLVFILAVPAILLYTDGYRIDPALHIYKTGGLFVSSPVSGAKIYINNKEKKQTNMLQSGLFLQSLKPGEYSVLIAKDNYWPWMKTLQVEEQMVTEARAILIPKNPKGEVIMYENYSSAEKSKYKEILEKLKRTRQPIGSAAWKTATAEEKETRYSKLSINGKEKLWWNPRENKLWVEWLGSEDSLPYFFRDDSSAETKILILDSKFPIVNAEFYPGRKDVVIVAAQNGIYALEIDGKGGRMLQPIYKGKEPTFAISENGKTIYVLEEDNILMEINPAENGQ